MDIRDFLRTLRRNWAVIVATLALFLSVASAYTLLQRPVYSASATAIVANGANATVNDRAQGAVLAQDLVSTYSGLATKAAVLQRVIDELDLSTSVAQLRQNVSASVPAETQLITISADARAPRDAARIANSVTRNLGREVAELSPDASGAQAAAQVVQVDPATAPTSPSSPNTVLNLGVAVILGLLAGGGLAVLRQRLDTRIRDEDAMREVVAAPVLGEILDDPRADKRPLITAAGDDSRRAEAFRTLRTNLEFLDYDRGARSMVVTSSLPQEGKSVTAANLAVVLAEAGRQVILIDADLRRPRVAEMFGLEGRLGLTDVLIGATEFDDAQQAWGGQTGLTLLPAGRIPPNPSELLQSDAMMGLIEDLEERFDVVLFDTPPLVPVSDAAILTRRTSGALLVAAANRTRRPDLRRAAERLHQVDGTLLGTVLTMVPSRRSALYGYERLALPTVAGETS
ncbi:polysaccharide biosynthesis tyrosine autokinase [Amnibacterium endophyticum]|uniref:Polysaccharide biosynthesis tyrosine autokinase n=1 Tax=Amnibacterium endophyticum TaxID=2109337 RepID=A0ABW4LA76_9MICO